MLSKSTNTEVPKLNGAHVECKTLRYELTLATEAEVGDIFQNAQGALQIQNILQTLNHLHPPTPLKTDNITAKGLHTITYTRGVPNNGTFVITGYVIAKHIINFSSIGISDPITTEIILRNIGPHLTIG